MKKNSRKYYRDLAIQAGEEFGALAAECLMCPKDKAEYLVLYERKKDAYYKMAALAEKAVNYVPTPDYES